MNEQNINALVRALGNRVKELELELSKVKGDYKRHIDINWNIDTTRDILEIYIRRRELGPLYWLWDKDDDDILTFTYNLSQLTKDIAITPEDNLIYLTHHNNKSKNTIMRIGASWANMSIPDRWNILSLNKICHSSAVRFIDEISSVYDLPEDPNFGSFKKE